MRALLYLESRYLRHQFAAIARSPLRLTIWIPYALSIAYLVYMRSAGQRGVTALGFGLRPHDATAVGGLAFGLLGITVALAASGRVAAFRSPAEAVLVCNAGISPRVVAVWLQCRRLVASSGRYVGTLAYVFLIFAPRHVGFATAVRGMLATLFAIAVQMSAELPVFLVARGRLRLPVRALGFALAAIGFSFAALGFFGRERFEPIVRRIGIDPGRVVHAVLAGDFAAIAAFGMLLVLSAVTIATLGGDALPELYAVTQRAALSTRGREHDDGARFASRRSRNGVRVPPGAFAVIWKDWIGFKRGRSIVWLWISGCVFWLACGVGVGLIDQYYHDTALVITLVGLTGLLLIFGTPSSAAIVIASDLGKPLFWLSSAPLRSRIAAWTFARTWRGAIAIALGPIAAGVVLGDVRLMLIAPPSIFATFWALQALGVGLYAVFPNPLDARGPMMFVRILATLAFALPAALAGIAVAIWAGSDMLAIMSASGTFALEGYVVLELASLRFAEGGATLATVARST